MVKMKKYISMLLVIVMIFGVQPGTVIKAAEQETLLEWTVKSVTLTHKTVEFIVDGVESAQDAVAVVTDRESGSTVFEGDFSINSASQKIKIDITDGYLKAGRYGFYVKNSEGKKTQTISASLSSHDVYLWISGNAYPNCYIAKLSSMYSLPSDLKLKVTATVGFQTYDGTIDAQGNVKIEYPAQVLGTIIKIKISDEYGCEYDNEDSVEDVSFSKKDLQVWHNGIGLSKYENKLKDTERIGVKVDGQIYYSEYGAGANDTGSYKERLIVSYPDTESKEVTVWYESKYGSKSKEETLSVEDCKLSDCIYSISAYQYRAKGKVTANTLGQIPSQVKTTIDGKNYIADVSTSGAFTIEYPAQENYKDITFEFYDKHNCSCKDTVSVYDTLAEREPDISKGNVLPTITSMQEEMEDIRLVAEINGEKYYGEYGQKFVEYPYQAPGTKINLWLEDSNLCISTTVTAEVFGGAYKIEQNARTGKISGTVHTGGYISYKADIKEMYVLIKGKKYECTLEKQNKTNDNYDEYEDKDLYYYFSAKYPKQKIGTEIEICLIDSNQITYSKRAKLKNIPPKLKIDKIDSSSTKVSGTTAAKSKVIIKVGSKKYKCTAGNNGKFSKKIKAQNKGTKISVSVTTPEGYTNTKSTKVRFATGTLWITNYVYRTSRNVRIKLTNAKKGDKVKVLIGSKTYTKKISSGKKIQVIKVGIKSAAAGTKVKAALYDKFKNKKDSDSCMIYYGNTIYKGMSSKNVVLTTWGYPVMRNDYGYGPLQWVFKSGQTTLYVYIKNGKVVSWQRINY